MTTQFDYCGYCGYPFALQNEVKSKTCPQCKKTNWVNVTAIAVACVPVENQGYILIRRATEEGGAFGTLNFPGGFIDLGEHWSYALKREFQEETGYAKDLTNVWLVEAVTFENRLLMFGLSDPISLEDFNKLKPMQEVSEVVLVSKPVPCGFPIHTTILAQLFSRPKDRVATDFVIL